MAPQVAAAAPVRYMQGIAVPAESVRPAEFFARTRRKSIPEFSRPFAGFGQQDTVELRKDGIIAGLIIKFSGALTVTPGTGTVASTARWPYDLLRQVRFTANGQSNLMNASGLKFKVRDVTARDALNDRGVEQTIGGVVRRQGTLARASEAWGAGSATTGLAAGGPVELEWFIPVAEDQVDLAGAIFAATSSTDLTLTLDYAQLVDLFTLTGNAAVTLTGDIVVQSIKYSIPIGADGQIVVPDLSLFHSIIQSRQAGGIANGGNELRLIGQGAGKTLLRTFFQVWNGAGAGAPLALNRTNFGQLAWRYGGNETPDEYPDGQMLRLLNERMYGVDLGGLWGVGVHEFAAENAFRDTVDMGTTSELRTLISIANGVALTNPAVEYVQETIFAAGAGS